MQLNPRQFRDFERDGYLLLPRLFSAAEVAMLRSEAARLSALEAEGIRRERSGAVSSILLVHESNSATRSASMRALTRTPRLMQPMIQLLGDPELYIHHTRIDVKAAFDGRIHSWHQDYSSLRRDGMKAPRPLIAVMMLDDAEEIAGASYFVPGSHRNGEVIHRREHGVGPVNALSVERRQLARLLEARKPVPALGPAGSVMLYHCNVIHGSGHNMSAHDRRQIHVVYNPVANRPAPIGRPANTSSINYAPVAMGRDEDVLMAMDVHGRFGAHPLWQSTPDDDGARDGAVYH